MAHYGSRRRSRRRTHDGTKAAVSQANPINATAGKFGHPATLVKDYTRWAVLARPGQVTLGSQVLVCKDPATAFAAISAEAFAELERVTGDIETCLSGLWSYNKINYLMLMMVDLDVHFHVIPRYDTDRSFGGLAFADSGWPGVPDLANPTVLEGRALEALVSFLREKWPR